MEILASHQDEIVKINKLIGYILANMEEHSAMVRYDEDKNAFHLIVWYKQLADNDVGRRMLKGNTYDEITISNERVVVSEQLSISDRTIFQTHYSTLMEAVKKDELLGMKRFFNRVSVATGYDRIHKLDELGVNEHGEL